LNRKAYAGSVKAFLLLAAIPALLLADTEPHKTAEEYQVHAALERATVAAEYLVRAVPAGGQSFLSGDFLVVEVALFVKPGSPIEFQAENFRLRINGKQVLVPTSPGLVAAALKYANWNGEHGMTASAGVGDTNVEVGGQPRQSRFPGDPNGRQGPSLPKQRGDSGKQPALTDEEAVRQSALDNAPVQSARSGCIYFEFKGKPKSIKKLELIYSGAAGSAELALK
jgi:hypothetical protein